MWFVNSLIFWSSFRKRDTKQIIHLLKWFNPPPPHILLENTCKSFLYLDAKTNWLTNNLRPVVLCDCIWNLLNPRGRPSQGCMVSPTSILVKILDETKKLSNIFLFIKRDSIQLSSSIYAMNDIIYPSNYRIHIYLL